MLQVVLRGLVYDLLDVSRGLPMAPSSYLEILKVSGSLHNVQSTRLETLNKRSLQSR